MRESITKPLCLFLPLLVCSPSPSEAFKIAGKITNGTTGSSDLSATVRVVNPKAGMELVESIRASSGNFTIENLDESVPLYLLSVDYENVTYTLPIRFKDEDPYIADVRVYETTTSWKDVRISIPHILVRRIDDKLRIEKMMEISNESSPPMTITGEGGEFLIYIPEDRHELNAVYVSSLGVPLRQEPIPTEKTGVYSIDCPIKPGITQVAVSFDVHYATETYSYKEPLIYDIDELTILTEDPNLIVTSSSVELEKQIGVHGFTSYRAENLKESTALSLSFSGGSPRLPSARVVLVPNPLEGFSIIMIIIITLLLLGLLTFAFSRTKIDSTARSFLQSHREDILVQLARLDDLFCAEAVPELIYREKRTELKNALASIYLLQDAPKRKGRDNKGKRGGRRR